MASKSLLKHTQKDGSWVYMWIAHYDNGTSLPQYDPYTLKSFTFDDVDKERVVKFGWYPFPTQLAKRLREEKNLPVKANVFLPKYEVEIDKNKRVIGALTTNFQEQKSYVKCPECNSVNEKKNVKIINMGGKVYTPQCPNCGTRAYWKCPKCNRKFAHIEKYRCPDCDVMLNARDAPKFETFTKTERWRIYKLGYQETINNKNYKTIMHIYDDGHVILKDN